MQACFLSLNWEDGADCGTNEECWLCQNLKSQNLWGGGLTPQEKCTSLLVFSLSFDEELKTLDDQLYTSGINQHICYFTPEINMQLASNSKCNPRPFCCWSHCLPSLMSWDMFLETLIFFYFINTCNGETCLHLTFLVAVSVCAGVGNGCVSMCASSCIWRCVWVHVYVEATDQPQVSILRNHLPCFLRQSFSLGSGTCWFRLGCLTMSSRDLSESKSAS